MKRIYQLGGIKVINNEEIYVTLKEIANLKANAKTDEDKVKWQAAHKVMCNKIREILDVNYVLCAVRGNFDNNVGILMFDYPANDINRFTNKYDEEKDLYYLEIEESAI